MSELAHCKDLSIYLGHACNFNCKYCDRGYIRDTIGGQSLSKGNTRDVVKLIHTLAEEGRVPPMISFHGGEPFYYVQMMTSILNDIQEVLPPDTIVFIQSNGSLIHENEMFFERFQSLRLVVSISFDFAFQGQNRTAFDPYPALKMMKDYGVHTQLQYVMPLDKPGCMSLNVVREIAQLAADLRVVNKVNLIPLRHIRGKDNFRLVLEDVDLNSMFIALLKFVEILYVLGVQVSIDGHSFGIQKDYFNKHKQLVLSPDGYVYPEYDFLEYKMTQASVGTWTSDGIELYDVDQTDLIHEQCVACPQSSVCGLKFLFHAFDREPQPALCQTFYERLTLITLHLQKLTSKKTLTHWMASTPALKIEDVTE